LTERVERDEVHEEQARQVTPTVTVVAPEVAPRYEDIAGSGEQQPGQIGIGVDMVDRIAHTEVHRWCHRIALLRTIDDAARQRAMALEAKERRAQPVALRWRAGAGIVEHGWSSDRGSRGDE
jgi:hypothetical protein